MDDIKLILQQIQKDMLEQKLNMVKIKDSIIQDINKNINSKFNDIELKTKELENQLEKQQLTLEILLQKTRRKNLIFFGIKETEKNYEELENTILNLIIESMGIQYNSNDIELVKRLGKRGKNVRPILVTFTTLGRKLTLLKNKKKINNSEIYIKEDFPPDILEKRKLLQEEYKNRREQGEKVILKYDKIVSLSPNRNKDQLNSKEKGYGTNPPARYKKRKPESPPSAQHSSDQVNLSKAIKKNKTTIDAFINRTEVINRGKHGNKAEES